MTFQEITHCNFRVHTHIHTLNIPVSDVMPWLLSRLQISTLVSAVQPSNRGICRKSTHQNAAMVYTHSCTNIHQSFILAIASFSRCAVWAYLRTRAQNNCIITSTHSTVACAHNDSPRTIRRSRVHITQTRVYITRLLCTSQLCINTPNLQKHRMVRHSHKWSIRAFDEGVHKGCESSYQGSGAGLKRSRSNWQEFPHPAR